MSSNLVAGGSTPGHGAEATRRQRFGLLLAGVLAVIATVVSHFGTTDTWEPASSPPGDRIEVASLVPADPAEDIELPPGPNRSEFQTSCLICHSARLPLGQPPFPRKKWGEIVHKMVAAYGASLTPADEPRVVDYLLAVRPPSS